MRSSNYLYPSLPNEICSSNLDGSSEHNKFMISICTFYL